jgi:hypothetical protein
MLIVVEWTVTGIFLAGLAQRNMTAHDIDDARLGIYLAV